ncbi:MAG: Calx-beta domain-containing protein [Fuerstiella sp.]
MPVRHRHRRRSMPGPSVIEILEDRCLLAASTFTPEEQLLLELVNRSRADPTAEAARQGIALNEGLTPGTISTDPKPPMAGNNVLGTVADGHTNDMLARGFFAHESPAPGSTAPAERVTNSGYVWTNTGENLAIQPYLTLDRALVTNQMHDVLFHSSGHRQALLDDVYFEVGVGVNFGSFTDVNNIFGNGAGTVLSVGMSTEVFGTQRNGPLFIVGVVFTDANNGSAADDNFFTIGEQAGSGGTITATNVATGQSYTETIGTAGGYSISVPAGTYYVIASDGGLAARYAVSNVVVGSSNVKVDFETTTAVVAVPTVNLSADVHVGSESDQTVITLTATASAAVSGNQTVNVSVAGTGITGGDYELSTTTITIADGETQGTATFTVTDDVVVESLETATAAISNPTAGLRAGAMLSIDIAVSSNDIAAFTLSKSTASVSESGTTDSFTVVLEAEPLTNVVINIGSNDTGEATVAPATLTFTPTNWNSVQVVTVSGVDDADDDGDQSTVLTVSVYTAASDNAFDSLASQTVTVTTTDDETGPNIPGNVDGDADFDANDSFLIQLVKLSGTDTQIDQSKGSSPHTATLIRALIAQLGLTADVDGDQDFDANDSFLIHLVKLSGTDAQIDQAKGTSQISATQIRANVNALGGGSMATQTVAAGSQVVKSVLANTAHRDLFGKVDVDFQQSPIPGAALGFADDIYLDNFRKWIDAI